MSGAAQAVQWVRRSWHSTIIEDRSDNHSVADARSPQLADFIIKSANLHAELLATLQAAHDQLQAVRVQNRGTHADLEVERNCAALLRKAEQYD
jgi:hypothetical protein